MNPMRWNRETLARSAFMALFFVCAALVVHEIFGANGLLAMRHKQREADTLQRQIQQLQKENQELEQQIKALQSDPHAIEKQAREELHLARPGEIIYTLPDQRKRGSPR